MSSLAEQQATFAKLVRFPDLENSLEAEDRRLAIYRRLVFNNVFGLVSRAFKRTYALVGVEVFRSWVREFIQEGVSRTPYFSEISDEFDRWMQHHVTDPVVRELISYERAIIALDVDAQDAPQCRIEFSAADKILLQPASRLLHFQYPVQRVTEDTAQRPNHEPTWLLLFRNPHNKLRFKQLSPAAFALLTLLNEGMSVEESCAQLVPVLKADQRALEAFAIDLLQGLQKEGGVLGAEY